MRENIPGCVGSKSMALAVKLLISSTHESASSACAGLNNLIAT
jgi:hypothetical protein